MNALTVFEKDGKLLTDSREVAQMVGKEHSKLLRDIRGYCEYLTEANFGLSEFFIEHEYQDVTGRTLPCFLCTRKGCDMIANKMNGRKGVLFTAQYTTAFEKMADHISQELNNSHIPFTEVVKSLEVAAQMLRLNDASKLLMLEEFYKSYHIPTSFLPKYEHDDNRQIQSATSLLKLNECGMSAVVFNQLLLEEGYLEEKYRTSSKGKRKSFKCLTEKGLSFGENVVSPKNQRETQPLYYTDSFLELFDAVTQVK